MRQIKKIVLLIVSLILITNSFLSVMPVLANTECYASFSLDTNYLLLGKTYTADFTKYPEDLEVTWVSSDTSIVTVTQTGVITPVSLGAANISIYYYDDYYGEDVEQYVTVLIVDSLGLESGNTYYIMNAGTGRLMASDSTDSSLYTDVVTLSDNWTARSKWEIFQSNDGHYTLYGFGGSSGILLEAFGTSVELESQDGDESEKFHIYRIENGIYASLYYIRQGDYYVAQDSNNNVYLTTVMGTNTRWSFMNVEKGNASMYSFYYIESDGGQFRSDLYVPLFTTVFDGIGYEGVSYKNTSSQVAYNNMRSNDQIFVFAGHGHIGRIRFLNANGQNNGSITSTYFIGIGSYDRISSLNNNELKNARCVIYIGCLTGVGTEHIPNLVDETFDKGAHFVLGLTRATYSSTNNAWLKYFFMATDYGYNIEDSIEYANSNVEEIKVALDTDSSGNNLVGEEIIDQMPLYYTGDLKQHLCMS